MEKTKEQREARVSYLGGEINIFFFLDFFLGPKENW